MINVCDDGGVIEDELEVNGNVVVDPLKDAEISSSILIWLALAGL
jgi:hypothetical protein